MRRFALIFAALPLLAGRPAVAAPSIVLDQPNPVYGQTVTFTATYPKEATRKVGTQQHFNPVVQVDCYQAGVFVFDQTNSFFNETRNADGSLTGHSGPITLGSGGPQNTWTSGAASCVVNLWYFGHDQQIHVLAQTAFEVGA